MMVPDMLRIQMSFVDVLCGLLAVLLFLYFWFKRPHHASKLTSEQEPRQLISSAFTDRMILSNSRVVLFYGSQTGTAENYAVNLHALLFSQGIRTLLINMESCDTMELRNLALLPDSMAVFIMATHGDGEPTDNARSFMEQLSQPTTKLHNVRFAVFGLGNSAYDQFNACAITVDRLLRRRGGVRVVELCLGDEMDHMESTFLKWQTILLETIQQNCLASQQELQSMKPIQKMYQSLPVPSRLTKLFVGEPNTLGSYEEQKVPFGPKNPFLARVVVNRELYSSTTRSCRHIELDIAGSELSYRPGDHVAVLPRNPDKLVVEFSNLLGIDLDQLINLQCVDELNPRRHPFPCPCTYRTALTHYVDLSGPPRLQLLTVLSAFAVDTQEADQLRYLGSNTKESNERYSQWVLDERKNVIDLLKEFTSIRIPADHLLELLPRIKPRFYSVSSSPIRDRMRLHLTVSVVTEELPNGRCFKGLTTQWLKSLVPENLSGRPQESPNHVPIYLEASSFRLPRSSNIPVIMVAAGTGLAPFRSFIRERTEQTQNGSKSAPMLLFFGCRHQAQDFIYSDELFSASRADLLELHLAFSRDSPDGAKVYVQHRMLEIAGKIWHLLDACNAHLYVCGSAKTMSRDVHQCLLTIVESEGRRSSHEAGIYLKRLRADGRYHVDVWG